MSDRCFIAAKAPRPGFAKTRLAAAIGPERALGLYRAFLQDLADRFAGAPFALGWYVTPPDAWAELAPLVRRAGIAPRIVAQPAGGWGERQSALFRTAASRGEERTVLIASDSPQVTPAVVAGGVRRARATPSWCSGPPTTAATTSSGCGAGTTSWTACP